MKEIEAKTILTKTKNTERWFNIMYNTNFYRGCTHNCIYCDSRSECYRIDDFLDINVKVNAPELLEKELKSKKVKGLIGTGAMCDPYLPIEKEYRLTRKCLEIINKYNYPVCITTKSDLVLDDLELLKEINSKTMVMVIFTLTTVNDNLAQKIEPGAPLPSKRLSAMKKLNDAGIYTGVLMMPVLPFIEDDENNTLEVIKAVSENGGQFIIPYFGVTLRDRQREYYYQKLDEMFPGLKEKYQKYYPNNYNCNSLNYKNLYTYFKEQCLKYNLVYEMKNVKKFNDKTQLKFNI